MNRTLIGGLVAIVIAALTATAYFVTTNRLEGDLRKEADTRVQRATKVLLNDAQLRSLNVLKRVEALASNAQLIQAASFSKADGNSEAMTSAANAAFAAFKHDQSDTPPDILALVDMSGAILVEDGVPRPPTNSWQKPDGTPMYPALQYLVASQTRAVTISEVWKVGKDLMRVGIAPVIDPNAPRPPNNPNGITAYVVAAYSVTADEARKQQSVLGTDVAYYDGGQVAPTSFKQSNGEADAGMADALTKVLGPSGLGKPGAQTNVDLGGHDYIAASIEMPRFFSQQKDPKYPDQTAGAIVLMSPSDQAGGVGVVKILVLVLGLGAIGTALFGLYMSNHRILAQVDQIELGVADIINGNLDRTFRPVGEELEGLANGMNVMLARLLGRPEPGEEEFDDDGNPIVPGRVEFEDADESQPAAPAADPDLAALAQEPEPDYYKRVFTEYLDGRKAIGNPDEVSFENFIAKLRVNEGKLKGQYNCKAVRFRVVVKDGKVTLKPVPIFG
jgi:hypothetical protein